MRYFIRIEQKRRVLEMKVSGESAIKSFSDKGAFDEFLSDMDASLSNQKLVDNSSLSIVKKSDGTEDWTVKLSDGEGHKGDIKFEMASNGDIKRAQADWNTNLKFAGASIRSSEYLNWMSEVSKDLTTRKDEDEEVQKSDEKSADEKSDDDKDVMSKVQPNVTDMSGVWTKIIEQSMESVLNDMNREYGLTMQRLFTFNLSTQNELKDEEEWLSYEGQGFDKNNVAHKITLIILKRKNGKGEYRISVDGKEVSRLKDQESPNGFIDWCRDNMAFQMSNEGREMRKDFSSDLRTFSEHSKVKSENRRNGLRGLDRKRHVGCSNLCCDDVHSDDEFGDTNWRDPYNTMCDDFDDTGWEYEDPKDVLEDELKENRMIKRRVGLNQVKESKTLDNVGIDELKENRMIKRRVGLNQVKESKTLDNVGIDELLDIVYDAAHDAHCGDVFREDGVSKDEGTITITHPQGTTSVFQVSSGEYRDAVYFYGIASKDFKPEDFNDTWVRKLSQSVASHHLLEVALEEAFSGNIEDLESDAPSDDFRLPDTQENLEKWVDSCVRQAYKNSETSYNSFMDAGLKAVSKTQSRSYENEDKMIRRRVGLKQVK